MQKQAEYASGSWNVPRMCKQHAHAILKTRAWALLRAAASRACSDSICCAYTCGSRQDKELNFCQTYWSHACRVCLMTTGRQAPGTQLRSAQPQNAPPTFSSVLSDS